MVGFHKSSNLCQLVRLWQRIWNLKPYFARGLPISLLPDSDVRHGISQSTQKFREQFCHMPNKSIRSTPTSLSSLSVTYMQQTREGIGCSIRKIIAPPFFSRAPMNLSACVEATFFNALVSSVARWLRWNELRQQCSRRMLQAWRLCSTKRWRVAFWSPYLSQGFGGARMEKGNRGTETCFNLGLSWSLQREACKILRNRLRRPSINWNSQQLLQIDAKVATDRIVQTCFHCLV